jgi:hypothetical protein
MIPMPVVAAAAPYMIIHRWADVTVLNGIQLPLPDRGIALYEGAVLPPRSLPLDALDAGLRHSRILRG